MASKAPRSLKRLPAKIERLVPLGILRVQAGIQTISREEEKRINLLILIVHRELNEND